MSLGTNLEGAVAKRQRSSSLTDDEISFKRLKLANSED